MKFLNKFTTALIFCKRDVKGFCSGIIKSNVKCKTAKNGPIHLLGQPTPDSHPHLLNEGEVTPLITKCEYQRRRENLIESILKYSITKSECEKHHMVIIPAATKKYMSDKIPYLFRQNSDFLYLTGCLEPDCCVVLTTNDSGEGCTTLFTREKNENAELWDGPRTHPEQATNYFGVDQSLPIDSLEEFLTSYKKQFQDSKLWYDFLNPMQTEIHNVVCNVLNGFSNKKWENPIHYIHLLRLYKSPAEIALMQKSCDIAARAFVETISCSKPGICESQIFARIDYECRIRGAEYLAYPPVVAGGNRANIIHYINNNQLIYDNELVLMDAGCECHGYSSDITRTWPVNGTFTTQQREIYQVVYDVQKELIKMCSTFPTLDTLFETMCCLLGKKLQEIKLIGIQPSNTYLMKAAYQLCPHHVSHYLGMDIHDTPSVKRNIKIKPGMVITIEPGIYINQNNKSFPKEYRGIGVRIEDDVLITVNGPIVLSRKCPKHIDEIESIAKQNQSFEDVK